ncbi:MAG TPA: hypothetical protein DC053_15300 [Lachnoclostridium sp.]|nr:hypothetical protein [Lachnoclostridium sp.]
MKKRFMTALLTGAMAASMVMPAMAAPGDLRVGAVPVSDGTEVWAGIIIDEANMDAKIKVEVPTLFAFVVKGTTAIANSTGIADGDLYLPNVKVHVTTPSDVNVNAVYELQTVSDVTEEGKLPFTNYSTYVDNGDRTGLSVKINGNIKNEGDIASRKFWTHTASGGTTDVETDFKHYNVSIDGHNFDTLAANGGLQMADADAIALAAPDVNLGGAGANIDAVTKYASIGETTYATFGVSVGGQKGQYKQVEESAKIGTIVWTISAEIVDETGDVVTAPDASYLPNQLP